MFQKFVNEGFSRRRYTSASQKIRILLKSLFFHNSNGGKSSHILYSLHVMFHACMEAYYQETG